MGKGTHRTTIRTATVFNKSREESGSLEERPNAESGVKTAGPAATPPDWNQGGLRAEGHQRRELTGQLRLD